MMSPGFDASLAADFWQPIAAGSIAWITGSDRLLVDHGGDRLPDYRGACLLVRAVRLQAASERALT
jgi:hypothetical protein